MNKNTLVLIGGLAAASLLASCSSPVGTATPSASSTGTATVVESSKAVPYTFYTPTSEQELESSGISIYGYLIIRADASFDPACLSKKGAEVVGTIVKGETTWYRVKAPGKVVSLLKTLAHMPGVAYAEPDYRSSYKAGFDLPDDPYARSAEYSVYITRLKEAWQSYGFGNHTPYVAAIDTGLNPVHEEFSGRVVRLMSAFESSDGGATNSYVGDGQDLVAVPLDENWDDGAHGSHVMGTIAANGDNGVGVAGVCWQSNLISYKVFSETEDESGSNWAVYGSLYDLIEWKVDQGIDYTIPVNMSLGGDMASYFAIDMINYGLEENVVVIAAMGNEGQEYMQYPAGYAGVIAVGATNGRDELVLFSNTGYHNSVCAPGYDIISTGSLGSGLTDSHYQWMSGTSMAAPFVTGLVTYMLTFNPYLTPGQIKTVLEQGACDLGDPGYDPRFGYGRVDALSTIGSVQSGDAPVSAYSDKVISVQLTNTASTYDSGVPGYEDAIPNETVYLFDSRERFVRLTKTNDYGFATFPMLPPGTYYVRSAYQGLQRELKVAGFGSADVVNSTAFVHEITTYNIQTLYNGGGNTGQDSVIDVYESSGELITSYDWSMLDSIAVGLLPGQTYYIRISVYSGSAPGHYSLWVSTASRASGTGQAALVNGDDAYEPNDSMNDAEAIDLDTEYDAYLADDDWFRITIPN